MRGPITLIIIAIVLIVLVILLAVVWAQTVSNKERNTGLVFGGAHDTLENVKVFTLGTRPNANTPTVLFIGGLGRANDSHIAEWNFDENAGSDIRNKFPHVQPTWGIQPMVARYTATMSFDWPGVGGSPIGDIISLPRTMEDEAKFVRELSIFHGQKPPYVVVGMSMGAKTALMMLSLFPDEVRAAVLIDPAPFSSHKGADALPSPEYEHEFPAAAMRIRAAVASLERFPQKSIKDAGNIIVHLDVVPNDAPPEIQKRNVHSICENELSYKTIVRHFGAGHAIMLADPRPIIASILRFVNPIC